MIKIGNNNNGQRVLVNSIIAAIALFVNGFGVYLTIHASMGAGPWDVLNLGLSKTFGMLYGTASITVSFFILLIDVLLREPIGIAMIIDAIVVGKSVDFFNWYGLFFSVKPPAVAGGYDYIDVIPTPNNMVSSIIMCLIGLTIMGYTQAFYMAASLGCGPRDTLLVGLKKRLKKVPIGVVSIALLASATFIGYLLGGPVGIGTIICAFLSGPIMQFAFYTIKFDATKVKHQNFRVTLAIVRKRRAV